MTRIGSIGAAGGAATAAKTPTAVEVLTARANAVLSDKLKLTGPEVLDLEQKLRTASSQEIMRKNVAEGVMLFGIAPPAPEVEQLAARLRTLAKQL